MIKKRWHVLLTRLWLWRRVGFTRIWQSGACDARADGFGRKFAGESKSGGRDVKIYCRCLELEVVRFELWLCLGDFFAGVDEDK